MGTMQKARTRARLEVTAAIKDEARRHLAAEGAARLSLRAVARELGMVSSALYRYFPSRDSLLTALVTDAHDSLGRAAEAAHDAVAGQPPLRRWVAVCEAVRGWGPARPHEYALVHGSPVPGYTAPGSAAPAAARAPAVLLGVVRDTPPAGCAGPSPAARRPALRGRADGRRAPTRSAARGGGGARGGPGATGRPGRLRAVRAAPVGRRGPRGVLPACGHPARGGGRAGRGERPARGARTSGGAGAQGLRQIGPKGK